MFEQNRKAFEAPNVSHKASLARDASSQYKEAFEVVDASQSVSFERDTFAQEKEHIKCQTHPKASISKVLSNLASKDFNRSS